MYCSFLIGQTFHRRLRQHSPTCPNMMAPSGRAMYPTAYTDQKDISATLGFCGGKKSAVITLLSWEYTAAQVEREWKSGCVADRCTLMMPLLLPAQHRSSLSSARPALQMVCGCCDGVGLVWLLLPGLLLLVSNFRQNESKLGWLRQCWQAQARSRGCTNTGCRAVYRTLTARHCIRLWALTCEVIPCAQEQEAPTAWCQLRAQSG
jgi:hypothetical protein